jgi:hypothetical protein
VQAAQCAFRGKSIASNKQHSITSKMKRTSVSSRLFNIIHIKYLFVNVYCW